MAEPPGCAFSVIALMVLKFRACDWIVINCAENTVKLTFPFFATCPLAVAARLDDLRSLEQEMFEQVPELTGSKHQLLLRKQPWIQLPCEKKHLQRSLWMCSNMSRAAEFMSGVFKLILT